MPAPLLGLAPTVIRALMTRLIPMLRSGAQGLGRVPGNLKRASDAKIGRMNADPMKITNMDVAETAAIAAGAGTAYAGARPHLQEEAKRSMAERALKEKNQGQIAQQILMQDQISAR